MATDFNIESDDGQFTTSLNNRGDVDRISGDQQLLQRTAFRCIEASLSHRGSQMTDARRVELLNDIEEAIEDDDELPDDFDVTFTEQSESSIVLAVSSNLGTAELEVDGTVIE